MTTLTIPPIRNREHLHDAAGLILSHLTQDELARVALRILRGDYGPQSDAFVDAFDDAHRSLEDACDVWERRNDPARRAAA